MARIRYKCKDCNALLDKNCVALNIKLLTDNKEDFLCLTCLSDFFDCSIDDLKIKIQEFKEAGCTLFL